MDKYSMYRALPYVATVALAILFLAGIVWLAMSIDVTLSSITPEKIGEFFGRISNGFRGTVHN